ncbi:MAG: hypothetical protein LKI76_00080 [Megasphaera sp.]|nr:hypothetical protein [Megasphaera sp.]
MLFLMFIIVLNTGISFWNAKMAGEVWAESKGIGGWVYMITWCTAIQAMIGFSYVYITVLILLGNGLHFISNQGLIFMTNLSYVFLIFPLLGTGLALTIQSWIQASREKSLSSLGIAGWNTFAQAYNMYSAVQHIGPAFSMVQNRIEDIFFHDDNDDNREENMLIIFLVVLAILAGIVTTMTVINFYAGSLSVSEAVRKKYEAYS